MTPPKNWKRNAGDLKPQPRSAVATNGAGSALSAVAAAEKMTREKKRRPCTVGQNNREYRLEYWANRSSVRSFARTAHSFACSALLASLPHFAHCLTCGTVND